MTANLNQNTQVLIIVLCGITRYFDMHRKLFTLFLSEVLEKRK